MSKETQHFFYGVLGFLAGVGVQYFGGSSLLMTIISSMGFWIFISCLIAYHSRNAKNAAVNALVFFLFMLLGYALYTIFVLRIIPNTNMMLLWALFAVVAPLWCAVLTFGDDAGFLGALCCGMPVALLLSWGSAYVETFALSHGLCLLYAVIVFLLYNRSKRKKWQSALAVLGLFLAFYFLDIPAIIAGWF